MQCERAGHNEHGGSVDILEGQVTNKLCLNDSTDVSKVGSTVEHGADGRASGDGRLDLAEVLLGLAQEFFGLTVLRLGLAFLCE